MFCKCKCFFLITVIKNEADDYASGKSHVAQAKNLCFLKIIYTFVIMFIDKNISI